MSANRLPYVFVVLALALVILLTFQQATATQAIARADRSYDQIEHVRGSRPDVNAQAVGSPIQGHRGGFNPHLLASQQLMTASGIKAPTADRSYDAIENLRAQRTGR